MKYLPISLLLLFFSQVAVSQTWSEKDVKVYKKFDDLAPLLNIQNDTTYVINFWATWCGPCVKELPYFEAITENYKSQPVKVILVSLDMEKQISSKLIPFLNKKKIRSEVVLLADGKANKWIDRVDPSWSGAIPITLVVSGGHRKFYEKEFHSEKEIEDIISPYYKIKKARHEKFDIDLIRLPANSCFRYIPRL